MPLFLNLIFRTPKFLYYPHKGVIMFTESSAKKYQVLRLSKFISIFLFALTPILAGITSGLLMNNMLFWGWILFGMACLGWFVAAVVMTNRMKPSTPTALSGSVAHHI